MTKSEIDNLLHESGVWNELAHTENGDLCTAITSYEELCRLIERAWQLGYREGFDEWL